MNIASVNNNLKIIKALAKALWVKFSFYLHNQKNLYS